MRGGNGYARAAFTNNSSNFSVTSTRVKLNSAAIIFPTPTGKWSSIIGFGIRDAASGGNLILVASFGGPSFDYLTGELVQAPPSLLSITL